MAGRGDCLHYLAALLARIEALEARVLVLERPRVARAVVEPRVIDAIDRLGAK